MPSTHQAIQRAERRVGYLRKAPHRILTHERYWSRWVMRRLLAVGEWLRFEDLDAAWELIRRLPQAVGRVRVGEGADDYGSAEEQSGDRIRALSLVGETSGLALLERRAEHAFEQARAELTRTRVSRQVAADYHQRLAAFVLRQGRKEEAARLADRAVELGASRPAAEALFLAGAARREDGLSILVESLGAHRLSRRNRVQRRLVRQAFALLIRDLGEPARRRRVGLCSGVFQGFSRVDPKLSRSHPMAVAYRPWVEGLAAWGACWNAIAEQRLRRACGVLARRGDRRAEALARMDWVDFLVAEGDPKAADEARLLKEQLGELEDAGKTGALKRLDLEGPTSTSRSRMSRLLFDESADPLSVYPLGLGGS